MAERKRIAENVEQEIKAIMDESDKKDKQRMKRSIYHIPAAVSTPDLNKQAYRPQVVSFGPFSTFVEMQEHKERASVHFLRRSGKPLSLFVESLAEVVNDLRDSYGIKYYQSIDSSLLKMMIFDGCFMLEILHFYSDMLNDYGPDDPIFSKHGKLYIMPYIRRDMLMLENQLPMFVLEKLLAIERGAETSAEYINKLILNFFFPNTSILVREKCAHVLDVYRRSLLQQQVSEKTHYSISEDVHKDHDNVFIRSATKLNQAGIQFQKSKTRSLDDISFQSGVLKLPVIVVDETTESIFLNLIAYERLHVLAGTEVTSYFIFMRSIIKDKQDVVLLHSKGIIQNGLEGDQEVAKLLNSLTKIFDSLTKNIRLDPESKLYAVQKNMINACCEKSWNQWPAKTFQYNFRINPWPILSLVTAIILFICTNIYLHYHNNESP
ncbi:hypothetical protein P3X46_024880 [Hevea brasiliensis]|uniref:Uncharacterized protein n=1 Tax=Hevea brasiliensis TaxID=3981 RepID=A0ABQ9L4X1_HEVBR|nr:UPF0481 protein At3g47200-like [Hevea brasiliensis]KAJ9159371.1 hypothetical protein P3X46_024880 [Hevea brasiliensis]